MEEELESPFLSEVGELKLVFETFNFDTSTLARFAGHGQLNGLTPYGRVVMVLVHWRTETGGQFPLPRQSSPCGPRANLVILETQQFVTLRTLPKHGGGPTPSKRPRLYPFSLPPSNSLDAPHSLVFERCGRST